MSGFLGKKHTLEERLKISCSLKGHEVLEKTKNKLSKIHKKLWANEEYKIKMLKAILAPEIIKKRVISMTGQKRSEESKNRMSLAHLGEKHSLETRSKMSKVHKGKTWVKTKAQRKQLSICIRRGMKKSEAGVKISKALKGKKLSQERCEQMKEILARPEVKRKMSKSLKRVLNQPEIKEKLRIARLRQILPVKDTKIETLLQQELHKRNVKFIKHPIIERQRPDLYLPRLNMIVFADGCWWHGCRKHCPSSPHKHSKDIFQQSYLRKKKYRVVRFWEHDINKSVSDCVDKILIIK